MAGWGGLPLCCKCAPPLPACRRCGRTPSRRSCRRCCACLGCRWRRATCCPGGRAGWAVAGRVLVQGGAAAIAIARWEGAGTQTATQRPGETHPQVRQLQRRVHPRAADAGAAARGAQRASRHPRAARRVLGLLPLLPVLLEGGALWGLGRANGTEGLLPVIEAGGRCFGTELSG